METIMASGEKDIKVNFLLLEAESYGWLLNIINVIIRAQEYPNLLKKFQEQPEVWCVLGRLHTSKSSSLRSSLSQHAMQNQGCY